jgi:CRISPR-associated protein Cmr6
MTLARRKSLPSPTSGASNAGLILASYLEQTDDRGKKKRELLQQAMDAGKVADPLYQLAFARWKAATTNKSTVSGELRVLGRLVVGLGGENVLETGITLHHTYGTPIIPGSALKGLASHYCHDELGPRDPELLHNGKHYRAIFGTTDDSGFAIFHDAWICPGEKGLVPDVMTPHHGDYYAKKPGAAPTDFDDPNPVSFLSAVGKFRVAVSCDNTEWAEFTLKLLKAALKDWGVGGKTNAGYGRMDTV